tara:strand:+ start:3454 stop:3651 length:198 start_codon:yes stop_codon:yes gene_type:complete
MDIAEIHQSLVNGQRKQMVQMIAEEELGVFWKEYSNYLKMTYKDIDSCYQYLEDAITSYFNIAGR